MSEYKRDPVSAPRLSGLPLRLFVEALESPLGPTVINKITADSGLERFRSASAQGAPPTQLPLPNAQPVSAAPPDAHSLARRALELAAPLQGFTPESAARIARAYRAQEATPLGVADRVLEAIGRLDRGGERLGYFIASDAADVRAQAEAATKRLAEGKPLSALDGVPVAVKDELDQLPYPTTGGTAFLGREPVRADATVVSRLRAAGAVLIGKTNMHEVGINPIGLNPHHGAARNPWSRGHITGGSSSGSAAAVAAGFCPIAIGADGGGSIRIPAGLCGVVGLKATWGRVSEHNVLPLCWSVGHVGPIGATVSDVAAAYALIAGPDPADVGTLVQPPPDLEGLERTDLRGVRLGLHRAWFEDAEADVVARCDEVVRRCVELGATVSEIPAPDLNRILWSHAVLILCEMARTLMPHLEEDSRRFGLDVRTNLAIARSFTGTDYVHALRHRHLLTREYLDIFRSVDLVVTPTTASTAPAIPEEALPDGESNLALTDALMRFARIPNLTGFPAIALPAGYDRQGLPVSLQLIARPWEENLLLRAGRVVEGAVERRQPPVSVRLLG